MERERERKKKAQSTLCASALEEKNVLRKTGGGNTPRKSMFILFFAVENVSVWTNFHKDGEVRDEACSPKKHQCVATNHDVRSLQGNDTQLNLEFPHFYTLSEETKFTHSNGCPTYSFHFFPSRATLSNANISVKAK